jgi:hypothetical protein
MGGGFLPPTAKYMTPYSKRPEAAALFAGLSWIMDLLEAHPDTNPDNDTPALLTIPVDNDGMVKDVHHTINDQTPTFHLLSPDYDILQAIRTLLKKLPITTNIIHVKSHQDLIKPFEELTFEAQINILAVRQAEAIYSKPIHRTGLFPSWVPGTTAALFHGQHQITKSIPAHIRIAKNAPALKNYLIRRSNEATNRDAKWDNEIYESITWKPIGETFKNSPPDNAFKYPSTFTTYYPHYTDNKQWTTASTDDVSTADSYGKTPTTYYNAKAMIETQPALKP